MKPLLSALALFAAAALPAWAQGEHDICAADAACRLASHEELDALRGGFDMDVGHGQRLRIDIGITRAVSVNDKLVAVSELSLPDLGQLASQASRQGRGGAGLVLFSVPGGISTGSTGSPLLVNGIPVTDTTIVLRDGGALIVQNGPNNFAPRAQDFGAQLIPTIVQNTLDNQKISTLTLISARMNSLSMLNTLRLGDMMNRATVMSGR